MIDPTPAPAAKGVVYSNCFLRRTNHQSTANIANATNLIVAHNPTYLYKNHIYIRRKNHRFLSVLQGEMNSNAVLITNARAPNIF